MADGIGVLIVDDSALMRNLIARMVEATPGLAVADRAMNGVFALQKIPRCNPDVIVLDLEMPEMNGVEFLRERKKLGIEIPVIILSSIARRGAEITMEALGLGASDFIMKPTGAASEDVHTVKDQLTSLLLAYGGKFRSRRPDLPARPEPAFKPKPEAAPPTAAPARSVPPRSLASRPASPIELIAIGISTGGPNALREVFAKLDPQLKQPIVVVQHMPAGFTAEFAKSLDKICPLEVKEAEEGDLIKTGRILIAPGDKHIEVERKALAAVAHLSDAPAVNGHRPSADVLFASVAREYGGRALGVIMTGMGKDGARELGSLLKAGALTLGQDEASSVVYGMPKVAWELGHVMEQVPLSRMAERLSALANENQ